MTHVIRILALASGHPCQVGWLKSFDPEAFDGRGDAVLTDRIEDAQHFESFAAAITCWRQQPRTRPLRPDGRPNKPLTAFTVEIEELV